ncbi:hypothetical protein FNV43_RR20147 [Rhamnella rubrinervis]|uniref:F-box domain-containing protein n=1 Tax=Rhamnella rubrinervis TaxID=2594499 RepID=A0A8K0GT40_9ROSA|nr:hypothetical protein FNV43_RR20147 [Rhamnella rubrinervis]
MTRRGKALRLCLVGGGVREGERGGEDDACINDLPDEILVWILCFLSLEEAIRTTILSRRWKNLWMNMPKLEISWRNNPYDFRPHEMSEVKAKVNFVNGLVKLHETTTTRMEELTICLPLDSLYSDDIDKWVEFSSEKQVKKLKLDFDVEDMRSFLFRMKDITSYYCFLAPPSAIRLYWLKDLYLSGVNVVDKAIECLFSNSPFIERFCLNYSQKLHKVEVADAPNLKYLEIIFCDHLQHLHISAPNLNTIILSVRGCLVHLNLYAPSLRHAAFRTLHSFMNVCRYNMFDYLLKMLPQFCQVNKTLAIGFSSDVATTICQTFDFSHQLPELSNVEHLQIEIFSPCPIWFYIGSQRLHHLWTCALVKTAPFLQKLSIKVVHIREKVKNRQMEFQCLDKDGAEKVKALANAKWQYYSHQHLKEVELIDFIGSRNELEIVLFVLEIAASVETVVIPASIVGEFCLRFDDSNSDKILINWEFEVPRGLDLSDIIIEEMPNTVCTPYNLQTLLLKGCEKLRRVPTNMGRHYQISFWEKMVLDLPVTMSSIFAWNTLHFRGYLSSVLIQELFLTWDFDDLSVQAKAARILVVLLCKHEFDARYQKPEDKLYIAQLHFPLIGRILNEIPVVYNLNAIDKCKVIIVILQIVCNLDDESLHRKPADGMLMGSSSCSPVGDGPFRKYSGRLSPAVNNYLSESSRQEVQPQGTPQSGYLWQMVNSQLSSPSKPYSWREALAQAQSSRIGASAEALRETLQPILKQKLELWEEK